MDFQPWNQPGSSSLSSTHKTEAPYPIPGPTSPQSSFLSSGQSYLLFPRLKLDNGTQLTNAVLAYKTWGTLDPVRKDNALVVCHALTGSADVEDWWGPLLGPGKLFDPTRFFIICANVLGSPYGSSSPCTRKGGEMPSPSTGRVEQGDENWDGTGWWGPEFPATTVRDDVRIQKALLDFLDVEQVAAVVGGSMGGMAVLEWPLCFPVRFPSSPTSSPQKQKQYIRALVPIATAANHSAWGISWAEAQRQSIYSDPAFVHGYYAPDDPPRSGLSAARMAALLTYRSRESFESRFGRRTGGKKGAAGSTSSPVARQNLGRRASNAVIEHNEGNTNSYPPRTSPSLSPSTSDPNGKSSALDSLAQETSSLQLNGSAPQLPPTGTTPPATPSLETSEKTNGSATLSTAPEPSITKTSETKVFSAQSYLRYQGDKFVKRFDANCYVHLTRKMDHHDVGRGRETWGLGQGTEEQEWAGFKLTSAGEGVGSSAAAAHQEELSDEASDVAARRVLATLGINSHRFGVKPPRVQVVSIESDGLFAPPEQQLIHDSIEGSELAHVASPDGHDGFLLEFEQINAHVERFLRQVLVDESGKSLYEGNGVGYEQWRDWQGTDASQAAPVGGHTSQGPNAKVKESVFGEVEDVTRW